MYRPPVRPLRSPGGPRPPGRFPSPGQGWTRGRSPYSPGSPRFSPGSNRGYEDGFRGFGFRRPQSFSPTGAPNLQSRPSDVSVEKYFSPSMLEDPWKTLQPVTAADAAAARRVM
ncbi:M-phase-specific PLK1-interacting protein [Kryptolebias marmoratus]|uniref:M-phase-specific PLK1-interacting protein n=1 Tax=Kryptolebias marmoratus TaxID=37003 RepID=UPI0007F8BC11|nr:M-phase-specific PLK1-interacting protein [Kryptolebias marmoratus]